jgi:hypothetical protein
MWICENMVVNRLNERSQKIWRAMFAGPVGALDGIKAGKKPLQDVDT